MTSNAKAEGRFSKADFIYIARDDEYQCPAGQRLRTAPLECRERPAHRHVLHLGVLAAARSRRSARPANERRVRRWEHEAVLDIMQARLDRKPDAMKIRRRTIEHVFGTLKHWMGSAHFLMKTLAHVPTEISLHALAYNLKRVIACSVLPKL